MVRAAADEHPLTHSSGRLPWRPASVPVTSTRSCVHPARSRSLSCRGPELGSVETKWSIRPISCPRGARGPAGWGHGPKQTKPPSNTDPHATRDTHKMFKIPDEPMAPPEKGLTGRPEEVTPALVTKDRCVGALWAEAAWAQAREGKDRGLGTCGRGIEDHRARAGVCGRGPRA